VKKLKDQPGVWSFCIKGVIGLMTRMWTLPISTVYALLRAPPEQREPKMAK